MAKTIQAKKKPVIKKVTAKKITAVKAPRVKAASAKKRPAPKAEKDINKLIALAAGEYAIEKKATDVKVLDVREITSFTDFFVIASASSEMQVKAVAENVLAKMRDHGVNPWKSEGWDALQWVIVDFVDVVVHIFRDTAREFYNLERLWADAPMLLVEDKEKPKVRKTTKPRSKPRTKS